MHHNIGLSETHVGKLHQLIKASVAVSVELEDVESGKERWLKKLKVLEAMVGSSLVNLEKWKVENKEKLLNIDALGLYHSNTSSEEEYCEDKDQLLNCESLQNERKPESCHALTDDVFVGNHGDEVISFSSASCSTTQMMQFSWHLPLPDLVSIFEGNKLVKEDYHIREEANQDGDVCFSSLYKDDLQYREFHGSYKDIEEENDCLRKQLEMFAKQACTLEKEKNEILLALSNANRRVCDLENQKVCFENILREECQLIVERSVKEDVIALQKKNEDNERRLNECKKLIFEMSQKTSRIEKEDMEKELVKCKQVFEESQKKNMLELNRVRSMWEMEVSNYKNTLEKAQNENLNLKKENTALQLDNIGIRVRLEETQTQANLLEKETLNLILQVSEYKTALENVHQDHISFKKKKDEIENLLKGCKNNLDTMLKENLNIQNEKREMNQAYKALILDFEKREDHVMMLEKEVLLMKEELSHNKDELMKQNLAKNIILEEIEKKGVDINVLEKELNLVKIEQESLMKMLEREKSEKKLVMQKLQDEMGQRRALNVSLELAQHEHNSLLVKVEDERMAKDAALEELKALKDEIGNLESELERLNTESEEKEKMIRNLMYKESFKSKHLHDIIMEVVYDDEKQEGETNLCEGEQETSVSMSRSNLKEYKVKVLESDCMTALESGQGSGKLLNDLAINGVCGNDDEAKEVKRSKALEYQSLFNAHHASISLLVELKALKTAMHEKIVVTEGQNKVPSALGFLHFLKV